MNSKKLFGLALAAMMLVPVFPAHAQGINKNSLKGAICLTAGLALTVGSAFAFWKQGSMRKAVKTDAPAMTAGDIKRFMGYAQAGFGVLGCAGLALAGYGIKVLLKK